MRRRWIRITLGVLVVFVVAVLAVRYLVPAEKWTRLAFDQLEKQTGLVARADGASISFPWPLGLRLTGLELEDPVERPGWSRLEASADEVVVVAELGSILRGKPNVREVRLVRPDVSIWLREAGAEEGGAATSTASEAGAPSGALALGLLSLEDAKLTVYDPAGTTLRLVDWNNRAQLTLDGDVFSGRLEGEVEQLTVTPLEPASVFEAPPLRWRVALSGSSSDHRVELDVEELSTAGVEASGPVLIETPAGSAPNVDARLQVRAELASTYDGFVRKLLADSGTLPPPWTVDDFELVGGRFEGEARWQGPLPEAGADSPLDALAVEGKLVDLRFELLGRGDLLQLAGLLRVEREVLRLTGIEGRGRLGQLAGDLTMPLTPPGSLRGTLQVALDSKQARDLAEHSWPRLREMAGPDAAGPETWPGVAGTLHAKVDLDWPLPVTDPAKPAAEPVKPPAEALRARIERSRIALMLPTLQDSVLVSGGTVTTTLAEARLVGVKVSGPGFTGQYAGLVDGWPEILRVRGQVDLDRLDAERLQSSMVTPEETAWASPTHWPEWMGGARWARADVSAAAVSIAPPPANLDLDLDLRARAVSASGYELRDVAGKARLVDLELDLSALTAHLGTGQLTGSGHVDWKADPPRWVGGARADAVPASALLGPFAAPLAAALTTTFSGNVDLDGPLVGQREALLQALTGAAAMRSGAGSLETEPILGPTISRFLGARADKWRDLDFRSLVADVRVENGALHFDRMLLEGDTPVRVGGKIGLDGRSDYRLEVRLPRGVTPELGALAPLADLLRDKDDRLNFGVNVTGPAAKPKVEIDFAEMEQRAKAKGKDRAQDLLKDKLDGLIGGAAQPGAKGVLDSVGGNLDGKAEEAAKSLLDRLKTGRKKGGG